MNFGEQALCPDLDEFELLGSIFEGKKSLEIKFTLTDAGQDFDG